MNLPTELMVMIFSHLGMNEQLTTISLLSAQFRRLVDHHPHFLQHLCYQHGKLHDFRRAGSRPRSLSIQFSTNTKNPVSLSSSWRTLVPLQLENVSIHGHIPSDCVYELGGRYRRHDCLFDLLATSIAERVFVRFESCLCNLNIFQPFLHPKLQFVHHNALHMPLFPCPACRYTMDWWKQCQECLKFTCPICGISSVFSSGCFFICSECYWEKRRM